MQIVVWIVGEAEPMEVKRSLLPDHSFEGDSAPYKEICPFISRVVRL